MLEKIALHTQGIFAGYLSLSNGLAATLSGLDNESQHQ